jgi:hypothetical protein
MQVQVGSGEHKPPALKHYPLSACSAILHTGQANTALVSLLLQMQRALFCTTLLTRPNREYRWRSAADDYQKQQETRHWTDGRPADVSS